MDHLMIDLETLGTKPASPIIAVGAVFFDPFTGELGDEFYQKFSVESALHYSRIAGDTFCWWMRQSDEARAEAISGHVPINEGLRDFATWVSVNANLGKLQPWGNGASFDITMIEVSIERILNKPVPWKFWNIRDVRTIKMLGESAGFQFTEKLTGVAHKAIDDAIHQARFTSFYWQGLHGKTPGLPPKGQRKQVENEDDLDLDLDPDFDLT